MEQIINELNSQLKKLEALNAEAMAQLQQLPEGKLEISKRNGRPQFYKYLDKEKIYLNKSHKDLPSLIQKRYITNLVINLKKKIDILLRCIRLLKTFSALETPTQAKDQLPDKIKKHIKPLYNSDEAYAKRWQAKKYNHKESDSDSLTTLRGDLVRSKTELIIADKLYNAGIPYHYEIEMNVDYFKEIYPDFYVLNKRTRKTYIWEHFGKMDDPKYCMKALLKLETYAKKGYTLGENLILTFESSQYHINTNHLDLIIETYFK